jgi:hypothetical protein
LLVHPSDVQAASASIFSSHCKRVHRSAKLATSYFDKPVSLAQSFVQRTFAKPFRLGALLAAVDELVDAAAQPGLPGAVAVP